MRQLKISQKVTNRSSQSVDLYLKDIDKISKVLTPTEEEEITTRIANGDEQAKQLLIHANLRFVVSVAKQYDYTNIPIIDLINEGNIGLIKAAGKFDPTKGFKFISYAVWWIRQTILQYITDCGRTVRMPINKVTMQNKIKNAFTKLEHLLEREPSEYEILEQLKDTNITIEDIRTLSYSFNDVSLNAPIPGSSDENATLLDTQSSESDLFNNINKFDDKINVYMLMKNLPTREVEILKSFYGLDGEEAKTLDEISKELCLTRERVRQIKDKAIMRLKRKAKNKFYALETLK